MCATLAALAVVIIAGCGDDDHSPLGPAVDVRPAGKMAAPDTTAPVVVIADDTPAGEVRMDGSGRLYIGMKALDAGGIKLRHANPCTLKVRCADGSQAVSARGLSPVSDTSDTLWFWGYWDACPGNTAGSPQAVNLTVSVVDMAGHVGADSRTFVQPVYVPPPQPAPQPQAVLASYTEPEPAAKVVSNPVAATCEKCNSSSVQTGGTGSANPKPPPADVPNIALIVDGVRQVPDNEEVSAGWEVRLCREGIPCTDSFWKVFGQHPLATDGVDEILARDFEEGVPADIVYPPLPPGENRLFLLMLGNQYLIRDIRGMESDESVFRFYIQHAPDPLTTLTWNLSRLSEVATGEVVNAYTGDRLADIRDGEVTIYPPLDKVDFIVRRGQQIGPTNPVPHPSAPQGSLVVEAVPASAQPRMRIVDASTYSEDMFKFRLTPWREPADATRLILVHTVTFPFGSDASAARSTLFNYELWNGATQVGPTIAAAQVLEQSSTEVTEYLDFNLGAAGAYHLPEAEQTEFTVRCRINDWPSALSGSVHRFSLVPDPLGDGTSAITARGASSGAVLVGPDQEIVGNWVIVRRWHPMVERLPLPTTTLLGGASSQIVGAYWRVGARGDWGGLAINTYHKKITFRVSWTDDTPSFQLALDNFKLYRRVPEWIESGFSLMDPSEYAIYDGRGTSQEHLLSAGGTAKLNLDNFPGSYADVVLMFGDHTRDFAGEEPVYERNLPQYQLKFDVANAHQGASSDADVISVTMLGDEGGLVVTGDLESDPVSVVKVGGTDANFVWSDYSSDTGAHSSAVPSTGSNDWTNGYLVAGSYAEDSFLPLDRWVLTK
ncbi:MAG: hypothetical protein HYT31_01185 [Parcubacteria group bacterium]|nr:hypothetical protein [Parcubacteria group bacterium]